MEEHLLGVVTWVSSRYKMVELVKNEVGEGYSKSNFVISTPK